MEKELTMKHLKTRGLFCATITLLFLYTAGVARSFEGEMLLGMSAALSGPAVLLG